jgi:hypothetical protein
MESSSQPPAARDTALFFLAALIGSIALQFSFPHLIGSDGFFHLRMAQDPLAGMPWMPQSIFGEGWVDHQFLFHLLMAPFAILAPGIAGAKLSAAVFAALATTACYRFLRQERVPGAVLVALLPWAASWVFGLRLEMPRAQSLALLFLVLGLIALQRARPLLLFVLAWAFMASYHVAIIALPIALLHAAIVGRARGAINLRASAAVACGLVAGLSIHPHSPRTFSFLWQHVVQKVANEEGLPVGGEWRDGILTLLRPHALDGALFHELGRVLSFSLGPLLLLGGAALALFLSRSRRSPEALLLLVLATCASAGLLAGSKAVEYAAPFSALALGLSLRDLNPAWLRKPRILRRLGVTLVALLFLQACWLRASVVATEPSPDRFAETADFLRGQANEGEVIYHFSWGDFPELVWHAPEFRYIVGLDPHFLQLKSKHLWDRYADLAVCSYANPSKPIRSLFGARWAIVSLPWPGAEGCMAQDPNMELVFRSQGALVYRVY